MDEVLYCRIRQSPPYQTVHIEAEVLDEEDGAAASSLSILGNGEGSPCPIDIDDSLSMVPRVGQLRCGKRHHLLWRSTVEDAPERSADDSLVPEIHRPVR